MARGHKKGPKNRQNATGDSRISILTEENDNYNPFINIKKMDAVKKVDTTTKQKKSNSKSNNDKIIEIDNNASFEEIFNQWETVGTLNSKKKSNSKVENEDFASIFNQWEVSQGLKPKYSKKAKDAPDRKKSNYVPKKDFSQILDEFEGTPAKKKSQVKKSQQNFSKKKESPKKEINNSNLKSMHKVSSSSENKKSNYTPKKDFADILNEFENKPIEKKEEVKEIKTLEQKIKDKKKTTDLKKDEQKGLLKTNQKEQSNSNKKDIKKSEKKNFGDILNEFENKSEESQVELKQKIKQKENNLTELKIKEKFEVEDYQKEKINSEDKIKPKAKDPINKDFGKILDEFENKSSDETKKKDPFKTMETTHKEKESFKHKKTEKDNNWKSHPNRKHEKKDNYSNKNREKKDYKPKESNIDPKWDFSNIYGAWEAKNNEEKLIEEKKKSEKKESKGISISYLRSMSPEDELDLHGYTSDIAALKVSEFLTDSRDKGFKKVSIITGKGNHSENGKSVIKDLVLEEIKYSDIVREAYHPKAVHGGSGAIWVIFKSKSEKKIYF